MNIERLTTLQPVWDRYDTQIHNQKDNEKSQVPVHQVSYTDLTEMVEETNKLLEPSQVHLKFELHEKLNEYYVKVIEDSTNEVVREIPPKQWLDFYAAMTEFLGLFVDEKK
ncbi:flagellar biosynthesis protein FlaG [Bacillus halotolerans]|uniref:flagellar protein FlaG n=1 Tax=Bacillus TaxID=1386 RepID=UPI000D021828|nr:MULTISPECIES: flagellar protein FlaG [Bacillus]MBV7319115.1 flagellar protein FlaG [Halalkalibacterium halodurans]AZV49914.1 flagellar biosynthesis protein FlaG [Bacillus halotolerans]MCP9297691.1 flagellar protein FlaG [Bacillus halotolerans]MCV0024152.1 flagellar protein FlaG [Bacillus sp. XT-2]PRP51874.1 flagellar biosynthesis protein FlaG [Bacillus halotolerans]